MIVSILLTFVFFFMAIYSALFVQRPLARYFFLLGYVVAGFFVWNPGETTKIANTLGMGRGLDLLFVLVVVTIVNVMFFMGKHLSVQYKKITDLARFIAIQGAKHPNVKP
jgi:small membrane protein